MNRESRRFSVHPAVIYDVICKQAGTLSKALLESTMNSVDAGATYCEITLDATGYTVVDDGRGIASRKEVESFFEVFGTPHEAGDARFGRFRIGRGQGFSFATNYWRTGCFEMDVDIKNRGLDYDLTEHPRPIQEGCAISGRLYTPLSPMALNAEINHLKQLVAWIEIPVTLNGERVNHDRANAKWDVETDDCLIRFSGTGGLKLYNLGAFVTEYPAHRFGGLSGIVVSKLQLDINTARNDVLQSQCSVFARIRKVLEAHAGTRARNTTERLTKDQRGYFIGQWLLGEVPDQEVENMKLFPALPSRALTPMQLLEAMKDRKRQVVFLRDKDSLPVADAVHRQGGVLILKQECFDHLRNYATVTNEGEALQSVVALLESKQSKYSSPLLPAKTLSEVAGDISDGSIRVKDQDLNERELFGLRVAREINRQVAMALHVPPRKLFGGASEVNEAWTNGSNWIAYNRSTLQRAVNRLSATCNLVRTLVHEYTHDSNDAVTHVHDEEFYEAFHDKMCHPHMGAVYAGLPRIVLMVAQQHGHEIRAAMAADLQRIFDAQAEAPMAQDSPEEAPPVRPRRTQAPTSAGIQEELAL